MGSTIAEADGRSGVTWETSNYCFLCLIRPEPEGVTSKLSNYSLKYLSRHLKLDLRKVASANKKVNPLHQKRTRNESCNLEVTLCEDCSLINQDFLELYRQLQQLELAMMYCLQRLQSKLVNARKPTARGELSKCNAPLSIEKIWEEELDTIMPMRREVMQCCSSKLTDVLTNAKELIAEAVNMEKWKVTPNTRVGNRSNNKFTFQKKPTRSEISEDPLAPDTESELGEVVKLEAEDDDDEDLNCPSEIEDIESQAPINEEYESEDESESRQSLIDSDPGRDRNNLMKMEPQCDDKLPPVVIIPEDAPLPKSTINPASGKHRCSLCPKEFDTTSRFQTHFKGIHAQLKYSCSLCGMSFSQKGSFDRHHQNLHMGLRFSCPTCDQTFTEKCSINKHQRKTGCGGGNRAGAGLGLSKAQKGPPLCHICGKSFTRKDHLDNHLIGFHSKVRII